MSLCVHPAGGLVVGLCLSGGPHPFSAQCEFRWTGTLPGTLLAPCWGDTAGEDQHRHLAHATVLELDPHVSPTHYWKVWLGSPVKIIHLLCFFFSCSRESLAPQKAGNTPLDMHQFRMLYNTCKVPGVTKDRIHNYFKTGRINSWPAAHIQDTYLSETCALRCDPESEGPCPSHLVVLCRGRIFKFDALCDGEILTPPEILR